MKEQDPNRRIQAARVRDLCGGVSDMWIWRRLNDDSGFPKPIYIARTRFWREDEIVAWLDQRAEDADAGTGRKTPEQLRAEARALFEHADALEAEGAAA